MCSMKQCSIYNSLYICIQLCPSAHGGCCLSSSQSAFFAFSLEIRIPCVRSPAIRNPNPADQPWIGQCDSGQAIRTHNIDQEQCDDFLDHQENCKSKLVHKMCSGRICVLEKFSCMCICSVKHFETKASHECKLN